MPPLMVAMAARHARAPCRDGVNVGPKIFDDSAHVTDDTVTDISMCVLITHDRRQSRMRWCRCWLARAPREGCWPCAAARRPAGWPSDHAADLQTAVWVANEKETSGQQRSPPPRRPARRAACAADQPASQSARPSRSATPKCCLSLWSHVTEFIAHSAQRELREETQTGSGREH